MTMKQQSRVFSVTLLPHEIHERENFILILNKYAGKKSHRILNKELLLEIHKYYMYLSFIEKYINYVQTTNWV
jgi:hypothetical protein